MREDPLIGYNKLVGLLSLHTIKALPKFNAQERSLIQTIVATLSLKRLSDAEIPQKLSNKQTV
ncbi:MAG: hypothetical protein EHM25_06095 [Nitrosopumilales archaeon]|nr:MAG: hypothetical protein EHM25_06095 [Nitrosopumilales archaeon]